MQHNSFTLSTQGLILEILRFIMQPLRSQAQAHDSADVNLNLRLNI